MVSVKCISRSVKLHVLFNIYLVESMWIYFCHPYSKIFNMNTTKLSHCCLPNVKNIIKLHNRYILIKNGNAFDNAEAGCDCRNKSICLGF